MALEVTELMKTKLDMLCRNEINFPSSKSLENLEKLQEILKVAGRDEVNDRMSVEWQELLRDIYYLEDFVESLLFTKTLNYQKFIVQMRLNNKIGRLEGKVRKCLGNIEDAKTDQHNCPEDIHQKESSSEPDGATQVLPSGKISRNFEEYEKQVPPSSEGQERVMETDSSLTTNPEDLQPLPKLRRTSSLAPHQQRLLSRKWSSRRSFLERVDDEAIEPNALDEIWADAGDNLEEEPETVVLQDLANNLAQPLLSPAMLQFLMLKAHISSPGKAILLWTVYNAETVKQYFQSRAWVCVSEESKEIDILKAIIRQAINDKETKEETDESLRQRLRNFLVPRRCLIVLYGDQAGIIWRNLNAAFPNSLNGSRVIIAIPHAAGSNPFGKALDEKPQQNLVESSVYLEDSSITIAKAMIDDLTKSILNPHSLLFLISIIGVVSSGEKTLLWPMYNAEDVKLHFHCRAWVHVPEGFKEEDLLNNIFKQVTGIEMETQLPITSLRQLLRNFLARKRYLVVLYDVWRARIWEDIKPSFPNTMNGSRVVLLAPDIDVVRRTNSWIFHFTPKKGLFHHYEGMQENASGTGNAKHWDTLEIMDEASGIVGLEDKIKEQAQLALNSYNLHWLISVLGVAGSGKTTIVRAFYNSIAAKQHFDCRAWINVPEDFDERDILLDLFRQLRKVKEKQSLSLEQLRKGLRLFLAWKRYLVVLDDVQKPAIWETLKLVLPDTSNGSRVILTTRKTYLAYHMYGSSVILRLRPLKKKESWELFSKRVAGKSDIEIEQDLKKKILERCAGLPLTILVLGSLLSKTDQTEWFKVIEETSKRGVKKKDITGRRQPNSGQSRMRKHEMNNVAMATQRASSGVKESSIEDQPTSSIPLASPKPKQKEEQKEATTKKEEDRKVVIETSTSGEDQADEMLSNMHAAVNMSYGALSFSSKCCLLYLGLFPKSGVIPIRRLFKLWLAEGLLIQPSGENKTGEDLANICFEELLDRELIKIADRKLDGSPKTCHATNTLHDFLFPNAEKFGFFHIQNCSGTLKSSPSAIRRLAGHSEINPPQKCIRHLRSYISFCKKKGDAPTSGINKLLNHIVKGGFPMLAVLDLEGVYKPLLSEMLGKLPKLKYLGLRHTLLDYIPESVSDLPDLETLDIKDTYITTLPGTLWNLRKLQHLYMSETYVDLSVRKPSRDSLNNLQTLWGLRIRRNIPGNNWLDQLRVIRKLKLTCLETSMKVLAFRELKHLESLKLRSISDSNQPGELEPGEMQELKSLKRLYLLGKLSKQIEFGKLPENLEILTLSISNLSIDPMEELGKLKNLKVLKLYAHSYRGEDMTCHSDGFGQLRVLKLWMLEELKNWTVEEKAMPSLENLEIRCCKNLKNVVGLENLAKLKELMLTNMKLPFAEGVKDIIGREKVFTQYLDFVKPWC